MWTARTTTNIDKCVVIYILVAKLAETVSASLVLYHTTRVERILVCAQRTEGYRSTTLPHLADTAIVGRIGHNYYQCLIKIARIHSGSAQYIVENFVVVGLQSHTSCKGSVESVVAYSVHGADARLR